MKKTLFAPALLAAFSQASASSHNCPYCKKFDPYLEKIVEKYPDVAVIFKFLPWRSESSMTSARDALTLWRAYPQQFMQFNHILMAKKGYHDNASIEQTIEKSFCRETRDPGHAGHADWRSAIVRLDPLGAI